MSNRPLSLEAERIQEQLPGAVQARRDTVHGAAELLRRQRPYVTDQAPHFVDISGHTPPAVAELIDARQAHERAVIADAARANAAMSATSGWGR